MADAAAKDSADPYFEMLASRGTRETVESILIALILVVLFRAFVSEPFIIPTGSMAPGLMGYHLDVACDQCGARFSVNASKENPYDSPPAPGISPIVVGGVCPICRYPQPMDRIGGRDLEAFSGDRILVNKFSYILADPQRWSVIVFHNPTDPYVNYIKRLIGLPGETIKLFGGDVYSRPTADASSEFAIARKPPQKVGALLHPVDDTDHRPEIWKKSGFPERWRPANDAAREVWDDDRAAKKVASEDFADLQFRMLIPTPDDWRRMQQGEPIASPEAYEGELITDFYAYNAHIQVDARDVQAAIGLLKNPRTAGQLTDFISPRGLHWVGDLAVEADVAMEAAGGELRLVLVEAGRRHVCTIDLTTGVATATMEQEDASPTFADEAGESYAQVTAKTDVVGPGLRRVRFANCDDRLYLWIDGYYIEWDRPATFERGYEPPVWTPEDPGDLAPVRVGVRDASVKLDALRVYRDVYYISLVAYGRTHAGITDYIDLFAPPLAQDALQEMRGWPEETIGLKLQVAPKFANFRGWSTDPFFATENLRKSMYEIPEDAFMPMGDNSPASSDGRYWLPRPWVSRHLMIGEALGIYWPHAWNRPVPWVTPNVSRMQFIH